MYLISERKNNEILIKKEEEEDKVCLVGLFILIDCSSVKIVLYSFLL